MKKQLNKENLLAQVNAMDGKDNGGRLAFSDRLRSLENAVAKSSDSNDYYAEVWALAIAVAQSVLKTVADPQRKAAPEKETVSNSGYNPAIVAMKNGIVRDIHTLDNARENARLAFVGRLNDEGMYITVTADKKAKTAWDACDGETLSDGMDLVQEAACFILDIINTYSHLGGEWTEKTVTVRELESRVLIRTTDSAKWKDVEVKPIQLVSKAVRKYVDSNGSVKVNPSSKWLYLEDMATDGESNTADMVYLRLGKCADIGGYASDINGTRMYNGVYTVDLQSVLDHDRILHKLNLTERQAQIVRLRMSGYGYQAIATKLGIREDNVRLTIRRLQKKCSDMGFTPSAWLEVTGSNGGFEE